MFFRGWWRRGRYFPEGAIFLEGTNFFSDHGIRGQYFTRGHSRAVGQ